MEPGVIGIFKPFLLLPEAITEHLTPAQFEGILAHELRHVERRDNLTAALHMLVETIFWFHPLVWWIRTRLVEERERACDEEVMRMGREPQVHAESILRVCEFYLAAPAACAAGVTGGELKKRIQGIMTNQFARNLSYGRKILLASVAILVMAGPIVCGLLNPARGRAQSQTGVAAAFASEGVHSPEEAGQATQPVASPRGTVSERAAQNADTPATQTGQPPTGAPRFAGPVSAMPIPEFVATLSYFHVFGGQPPVAVHGVCGRGRPAGRIPWEPTPEE
jgi:hypothetical protein